MRMRSFFALVICALWPAACATEREAPFAIFADPGGMIVQKATRAALAEKLMALQCKSILSSAKTSSAKVNTRRRPKAIDSRSPLSRHCQPNSIAASLFCSPLNTPRPKTPLQTGLARSGAKDDFAAVFRAGLGQLYQREGKLDTATTYVHQALNGFARNSLAVRLRSQAIWARPILCGARWIPPWSICSEPAICTDRQWAWPGTRRRPHLII